jgi:phosphatidylglycerophosphate synthase
MSHDTIVHRIVRPSIRVLAKTSITPDHLTSLRFATGVAAAMAFAIGGPRWIGWGAAIFLFSALLDRADGELARQTQQLSRHGHRYDLLADWSAGAVTFIGLGVGARGGPLGLGAPALGVLAAIGESVLFWGINTQAARKLPGQISSRGRVLMDPDDAMFAIPPLLWCFGPPGVLLPAGTLAPLLAAWLLVRLRVSRPAPAWRHMQKSDTRAGGVGGS